MRARKFQMSLCTPSVNSYAANKVNFLSSEWVVHRFLSQLLCSPDTGPVMYGSQHLGYIQSDQKQLCVVSELQ